MSSAMLDQSKFNTFFKEVKDTLFADQDDATMDVIIQTLQSGMVNAGICLVAPANTVVTTATSGAVVKTAGRLNSYTLFMKVRSAELKAQGTAGSAMTQTVAAEWKLKTDAEKAEWKAKAEAENNNNGIVKGEGVRKSSGPSNYNIFIKTRVAELKATGIQGVDATAQALGEWRAKKAAATASA